MTALVRLLRSGWGTLRAVLGDDAYERYVAHCQRHHPGREPLGPAAFQRTQDDRRGARLDRCC